MARKRPWAWLAPAAALAGLGQAAYGGTLSPPSPEPDLAAPLAIPATSEYLPPKPTTTSAGPSIDPDLDPDPCPEPAAAYQPPDARLGRAGR